MFTIYALSDPLSAIPFYVGCTTHPRKRYLDHLRPETTGSQMKWRKVRELRAGGMKPTFVTLATTALPSEAKKLESEYIILFRELGHPLTNIKLPMAKHAGGHPDRAQFVWNRIDIGINRIRLRSPV